MPRALCADEIFQSREGLLEDVAVEEEERRERLVLGRGGDAGMGREVREESVDLPLAHLGRMPLAVEQDEAADPGGVRLLGAEAVVAHPDRLAEAIEQTRSARRVHTRCLLSRAYPLFLPARRGEEMSEEENAPSPSPCLSPADGGEEFESSPPRTGERRRSSPCLPPSGLGRGDRGAGESP